MGGEHLSGALLARILLVGYGGVRTAELAEPVYSKARGVGLALVRDYALGDQVVDGGGQEAAIAPGIVVIARHHVLRGEAHVNLALASNAETVFKHAYS